MRVMVVGASPLPHEKSRIIYGINQRTWQIVKALLDDDHVVCLAGFRVKGCHYAEDLKDLVTKKQLGNLTYYSIDEQVFHGVTILREIWSEFKPDCLVGVNSYPAYIASRIGVETPYWADLNGDVMAEAQAKAFVYDDDRFLRHFWQFERAALERADIFSTVSTPQKYAVIGELSILGRLNKATFGYDFVHVIENGIVSEPFKHTKRVLRGVHVGEKDFVVLWAGGYNTWTDVDTLAAGLEGAMRHDKRIKFVSIGGEIAGHDEKTFKRFSSLVARSKFRERFFLLGWQPTEQVPNYYLESDVGINVDKFNYETILGARTRILDFARAGLPTVTSLGTEISEAIHANKLGFTYRMGDPEDLAKAILRAARSRSLRLMGRKCREYALKSFTYEKTTQPLREWVRDPKPSPDRNLRIDLQGAGKEPRDEAQHEVSLLDRFRAVRKQAGMAKASWITLQWMLKETERRIRKPRI